MQITFTHNVPVLAAALFFAPGRHLNFNVLHEVFPATNKDSPRVVFSASTGLTAAFVESDFDLHITSVLLAWGI